VIVVIAALSLVLFLALGEAGTDCLDEKRLEEFRRLAA
jgi:hypothetical protein